jgi:hypothetical protein
VSELFSDRKPAIIRTLVVSLTGMNLSGSFVYLDEAAALANVSRRSIDRDIANGRLSQTQTRRVKGRKQIHVAELERVYGMLARPETVLGQRLTPSETETELVRHLKEEIERERERTRKAEDAAERWEARYLEAQERLNGLLLPPPKRKSVTGWLFRR